MLKKSLSKNIIVSLSLLSSFSLAAQPAVGTRLPNLSQADDAPSESFEIPQQCESTAEQIVNDCLVVIEKYETSLVEQEKYSEGLETEVSTLLEEQQQLIKRNEELRSDRDAWYRSPLLILGIGLVGGFAASQAAK